MSNAVNGYDPAAFLSCTTMLPSGSGRPYRYVEECGKGGKDTNSFSRKADEISVLLLPCMRNLTKAD